MASLERVKVDVDNLPFAYCQVHREGRAVAGLALFHCQKCEILPTLGWLRLSKHEPCTWYALDPNYFPLETCHKV